MAEVVEADFSPAPLRVTGTRRNDLVTMRLTITEAGTPKDMSGHTVVSQLRKTEDGDLECEATVDMTDAAAGTLTLTYDLTGLSGHHVFDIDDRTDRRTLVAGQWPITKDASHD